MIGRARFHVPLSRSRAYVSWRTKRRVLMYIPEQITAVIEDGRWGVIETFPRSPPSQDDVAGFPHTRLRTHAYAFGISWCGGVWEYSIQLFALQPSDRVMTYPRAPAPSGSRLGHQQLADSLLGVTRDSEVCTQLMGPTANKHCSTHGVLQEQRTR